MEQFIFLPPTWHRWCLRRHLATRILVEQSRSFSEQAKQSSAGGGCCLHRAPQTSHSRTFLLLLWRKRLKIHRGGEVRSQSSEVTSQSQTLCSSVVRTTDQRTFLAALTLTLVERVWNWSQGAVCTISAVWVHTQTRVSTGVVMLYSSPPLEGEKDDEHFESSHNFCYFLSKIYLNCLI